MGIIDALAWLDSHHNLEHTAAGPRPRMPTLDRIEMLVSALGDPQHDAPMVHITGTNGKGSVARMVTSLLLSAGLSTGTYTSPHLQRVNERIRRNGVPIDDDDLFALLEIVGLAESSVGVDATYFELLTAAAYRHFSDEAVEAAVVEVGMAGRWDATNVGDAAVAVITNVDLDHVEYLGSERAGIAAEKAGIVKSGSTLVLGETDPELAPIFDAAGAASLWRSEQDFAVVRNDLAVGGRLVSITTPTSVYPDVMLPLHGAHQATNAGLAVAAAEAFVGAPLADEIVRDGLAAVAVPGRFEVVGRQPLVVLDGAHNPHGCRALAATLAEGFDIAPRVWVLGMLGDDPRPRIDALGIGSEPDALVVCCAPPSPRAVPSATVAEAVTARGVEAVVIDDVPRALQRASDAAGEGGGVIVVGSLYLVGAARDALGLAPA